MIATPTMRESLKRLYQAGKITDVQLQERITLGKIDQEDYDYITA